LFEDFGNNFGNGYIPCGYSCILAQFPENISSRVLSVDSVAETFNPSAIPDILS
jgi:hypothetical protein